MNIRNLPLHEFKNIINTIIEKYEINGLEIIHHRVNLEPKSKSEKTWGVESDTGFLTVIIKCETKEPKYFKPIKSPRK